MEIELIDKIVVKDACKIYEKLALLKKEAKLWKSINMD